jgi:hypothetical protein
MDTIIIKIYGPSKFKILDKSQFVPEIVKREYRDLSPSEKNFPRSRPYLRRYVLHPKNMYEYKDEYIPRVEVFETFTDDHKDIRYIMKIEFSVPKLLYGNSVLEVVEGDKERVLVELKAALAKVNIIVEIDNIAKAALTTVHLCKNVLLPRTIKMREILNELQRVDINKVFDVTGKQFKNGGRVLSIYSGVIEHVFYDKISDSIRPKNKRSDKGHISPERDFIERHDLQDKELFRYEYRIKKTQTVRREVNEALGRDLLKNVLFKDIFTKGVLKKMTVSAWRGLIERPENQLALFRPTDKLTLFLHILGEAEKGGKGAHSMNAALISYGLSCLIQDHGAKEVRRAVFAIWCKDHPERLTRLIKEAAALTTGLPYSNGISFVDAAVEKYEHINLDIVEKGL